MTTPQTPVKKSIHIAVKKMVSKTTSTKSAPVKGVTVRQLEEQILKQEGIRVVIRAPADTLIPGRNYTHYVKGFQQSNYITFRARVQGLLNQYKGPLGILHFDIIDGSGRSTFKAGTTVQQIRNTYAHPLPR